jgi:hypothetical protein
MTWDAAVFLGMMVWMVALLFLSPIPDHYKVLYFGMLCGVALFSVLTDAFRGAFGIAITIVSALFTILDPILAVQCILFFGLLGIIGTMMMYISPEVMLLFVAILLIGAYSIVILSFFALKQDMYLTAFMVPFMLILWACVIRARPPLRP